MNMKDVPPVDGTSPLYTLAVDLSRRVDKLEKEDKSMTPGEKIGLIVLAMFLFDLVMWAVFAAINHARCKRGLRPIGYEKEATCADKTLGYRDAFHVHIH